LCSVLRNVIFSNDLNHEMKFECVIMKTAIYQFAPAFGAKEKNLQKIEKTLLQTDVDLVVLPELCTTGYQFTSQKELDDLAESIPGSPTVESWSQLCQKKGFHLVAGLAEKDGDQFFNSAVLIGPEGYIGTYRKVHLFLDEKKWFQSGCSFHVWDIEKAKIGIMICFDWIFPEAARSLALQGAEIICHPVNLVLPYCQDAMITRSIENRVFTVTANRIGIEERVKDNPLTFTGGSQIVDPKGQRLFRLGAKVEAFQEMDIHVTKARDKQITAKNHIFYDRNPKVYQS